MAHERRRGMVLVGIALAALVLLLVVGALRWSLPTVAPSTAPLADAPGQASTPPPRVSPTAPDQPPALTPPAHAPDPRSPHEEALLALAEPSGLELVRCPLPDDIADVQLDGDAWSAVHAGVLSLAVEGAGARPLRPKVELESGPDLTVLQELVEELEDADGEDIALIAEDLHAEAEAASEDLEAHRQAREPVAFARIERTASGSLHCTVHPPESLVDVTVTVVDPGGGPVSDTFVGALGRSATTDADGIALIGVVEGVPTEVVASRMVAGERTHLRGSTTTHGRPVTITLEEAPPTQDLLDDMLRSADAQRRHLDRALSRQDLSDEARQWLERWRSEADDVARRTDEDPVVHHGADGSTELQ